MLALLVSSIGLAISAYTAYKNFISTSIKLAYCITYTGAFPVRVSSGSAIRVGLPGRFASSLMRMSLKVRGQPFDAQPSECDTAGRPCYINLTVFT
jgi:hypothetical protein